MPAVCNLRSPYEKVGGLVYFGRMIDKIRLHSAGVLPEAYQKNYGADAASDGRCCRFLGITHADLGKRVANGLDEDSLLAWARETGADRSDEEVEVWNTFMMKRGWRDATTANLREAVLGDGLDPALILTRFDYLDVDEGRPLRSPAE